MSNPIITENQQAGTTTWQPATTSYSQQIQAYCDQTSYNIGDTVTFYVSVATGGTNWTLKIFRLGWYDGRGGCLKYTSPAQVGAAQGIFNGTSITAGSATPYIDATTHLVEANWAASYTWVVPAGSVAGMYVAQFTDTSGNQTYTNFVVKGNTSADYALVYAYNTSNAYNSWGGYSLYSTPRAYKVSFLRPNNICGGTGNLFRYDVPLIKWLERQGYNVTYISDVDLHTGGASSLANYKALLTTGHAEYWSYEMRGAVETALTQGVGLAFLGANEVYWQVRYEADHGGTKPNSTVTCYKVATGSGTDPLTNDPMYGVDNTRVTSLWRDAVLNRPEAALMGIMYSHVINNNVNVPWTVDTNAGSLPLLAGTGLVPGQSYGSDIVGNEYDNQQSGSPANLVLIGNTSVTSNVPSADVAHSAYYYAPSGALVFAAGSIFWTSALDTFRWTFVSAPTVVLEMQRLLANIMTALVKVKGGNASASTVAGASHT